MAVQPLSPATDRRFGGPLPRQLANRTRVHLRAIKSLTYLSCGKYVLCGISVLFRTLFPSQRQVTHALLTRPPLKYISSIRKLLIYIPVRLACVRHAASVRPEPGSNSLNYCILRLSPYYLNPELFGSYQTLTSLVSFL